MGYVCLQRTILREKKATFLPAGWKLREKKRRKNVSTIAPHMKLEIKERGEEGWGKMGIR